MITEKDIIAVKKGTHYLVDSEGKRWEIETMPGREIPGRISLIVIKPDSNHTGKAISYDMKRKCIVYCNEFDETGKLIHDIPIPELNHPEAFVCAITD